MTVTPTRRLTSEEVVALNKQYTLFSWSAQNKINPIAMDHGEGIYFWDSDGKRYIDFNSQLMSVNIGHGDKRVADAIAEQAHQLAFAAPQFATEVRGRLGELLATLTPGNLDTFFFTLGGAEANENALRMARITTGRQKVIAHHRSYHGATAGAVTLTGDPRRWAAEPGMPGVVRFPDFYPYRAGKDVDDAEYTAQILNATEDIIQFEGPHTIAAMLIETVVGTNGLLIPSAAYIRGLRALCTKYGILLICDEVMSGFGRCGEWFAWQRHGEAGRPDLMTLAKGLTGAHLPLGAVVLSAELSRRLESEMLYTGLTYCGHPLSCAAGVAWTGTRRGEKPGVSTQAGDCTSTRTTTAPWSSGGASRRKSALCSCELWTPRARRCASGAGALRRSVPPPTGSRTRRRWPSSGRTRWPCSRKQLSITSSIPARQASATRWWSTSMRRRWPTRISLASLPSKEAHTFPMKLSPSGNLFNEYDVVAEVFEPADVVPAHALGVAPIEIVTAQVVVGDTMREHVPQGDEHGVLHSDNRLLGTTSSFDPVIERAVVTFLAPGRGPGRLL